VAHALDGKPQLATAAVPRSNAPDLHGPDVREARVDLAACFRMAARLGMHEGICNHFSAVVPGHDELFLVNPYGRAFAEVTASSLLICDYLDGLHDGRRLIPAEGSARWQALRLHAIAQGLCDAGIALRWETLRRPEHLRYPPLSEGQTAKLVESFDVLERNESFEEPVHIGHIGLATALAWLEFRNLPDFRTGRPRLTHWYEAFSRRPSMQATAYHGETQDRPAARAIAG